MPGKSSSVAAWSTLLEPVEPSGLIRRAEDVRLGEVVTFWRDQPPTLQPGQPVLLGFPVDEGVRRNYGRPGAAQAPGAIRRALYNLCPWDSETGIDLASLPPVDLGNVKTEGGLEQAQARLGEIIAAILETGAVPIVIGGGHETAYGHYLGYVANQRAVGIINLDAHLDVRPLVKGLGHSGSAFRQALDHSTCPLPGDRYVCLGFQPQAVSRSHLEYVRDRGCVICSFSEVAPLLCKHLQQEHDRLAALGCGVFITLDADVVQQSDVPGVSAPNANGLEGKAILAAARLAGGLPQVHSFELVEINPLFDSDHQSARWAALALWNFMIGLGQRRPRN